MIEALIARVNCAAESISASQLQDSTKQGLAVQVATYGAFLSDVVAGTHPAESPEVKGMLDDIEQFCMTVEAYFKD